MHKHKSLLLLAILGLLTMSTRAIDGNDDIFGDQLFINEEECEFAEEESFGLVGDTKADSSLVYVGTYATADQDGIFVYRLNTATGELTSLSSINAGAMPSYLNFESQRKFLYAVSEGDGNVKAYTIDQTSGSLTLINQQPCNGPAHVSVDHTDKVVMTANYGEGSVSVFPLLEDGSLGPVSDFRQHTGSSVNKERQEGPHPHFIIADPENRYAIVMDLGLDKIFSYGLDPENAKFSSDALDAFVSKPGAGPRHIAFHPNARYAYAINELDSTIVALEYDNEQGTFTEIETVSTVPDGFQGENNPAAIHTSPDGRYLYGSNRGHDSIVVFQIEEDSGKLTLVEHVTEISQPRDFEIDLTGRILLAGQQKANSIVTYQIDSETGKLTKTGYEVEVVAPTCIKVVPDVVS